MVRKSGSNTMVHEGIEYELTKVAQNAHTNNYGSGYVTVRNETDRKAGKFYLIELEMRNIAQIDKEIALPTIALCDADNFCLKPSRIDVKSIIDIPSRNIVNLKPEKKIGRTLIFPGPKSFVPKYVLLDQKNNVHLNFLYKTK